MKYYLYISDAKVDMLLPQIPHDAKRKVATELGFDLKILKVSRKTEEDSDENRISRLETVVEYIRKYGKVGTVDEPDDFIDDTQMMWSGPDGSQTLAYFAGRTDKTVFGFAGSAHHLIGSNPGEEIWPGGSALNSITRWLMGNEDTKWQPKVEEENLSWKFGSNASVFHMVCALAAHSNDPDEENRNPVPAQQSLEIFAKRLLFNPQYDSYWQKQKLQVLLGTPLYIAMTD